MTGILQSTKSFFRILNHPLNKHNMLKTIAILIWWKINQKFFHLPVIVEIDKQIKCICYPTSSCGGLIIYSKFYEFPEMMFTKKILNDKSIFFDVGANIGIYTLLAATKIKKGKIYAFEPVDEALDILYQNIRINNLNNKVEVIEKVVSDKSGMEKFTIQNISEYSRISTDRSAGVSIPSVKIDDFCKKNDIKFIDLIKIDVEGAEMKVLRGGENYMKNGKIGVLIIELSTVNPEETLNYIRQFNYSIFEIDKIDNDYSLKEVMKADKSRQYNIIAILDKKK